jgi:integrase
MKNRGLGSVYQPVYKDKQTGEHKASAVWWIRYHHRGRKHRESSESTKRADAVKLLKRRMAEIGQGRLLGPDIEKTTFEDLASMLLADYRANGRRSLKRVEDAIAHLRRYFKDSKALDIRADGVTAYITNRQEEGAAAATINRELAALKRAFTIAVRAGRVAQRPHIQMLQENNRRKGFFEEDQYRAVLDRSPEDLRPPISVAYITGWRITSEILTRQKHHVDLAAGWLRLEPGETKNGEGRNFPLVPELRIVLERQLERTRSLELATGQIIPWLFHRKGKPIKDFRGAWETACRGAGVPGRIPHDFRRTAVRNLERSGVPRSAAMAMVGHKTEAIYRRYAIADEVLLREAGERLAAYQAQTQPTRVISLAKIAPQ